MSSPAVSEFTPISESEIQRRNRWLAQELIRLPPEFKDWLLRFIESDNPQLNQGVLTGDRRTYSVSNVTKDRTYDANSLTLDELADVVGTLISDLREKGLVG